MAKAEFDEKEGNEMIKWLGKLVLLILVLIAGAMGVLMAFIYFMAALFS